VADLRRAVRGQRVDGAVTVRALRRLRVPRPHRDLRRRLRGPVDVAWGNGPQTDVYDQPDQVAFAVDALTEHFTATLTTRKEVTA
jgi:hypothetical protein